MGLFTHKTLKYGQLSPFEQDDNGFVYGGTGNTAANYHGVQNIEVPGLLAAFHSLIRGDASGFANAFKPTLLDSVANKVHHRQGPDIAPTDANGDTYHVDGGSQAGNPARADWNIDIAVYDSRGKFEGTEFWVDLDTSDGIDFLKYKYDADTDLLVAKVDGVVVHALSTGPGNGAEPGDTLWESFNVGFIKDMMYNSETGDVGYDYGAADLRFKTITLDDGPIPSIPMLGAVQMTSDVHVVVDDIMSMAA